jgi:hypothetical protein
MVGHLNLVADGVRDRRSILAGLRYGGIGEVVTEAPQLHESVDAIAVCDPVRYIHS